MELDWPSRSKPKAHQIWPIEILQQLCNSINFEFKKNYFKYNNKKNFLSFSSSHPNPKNYFPNISNSNNLSFSIL